MKPCSHSDLGEWAAGPRVVANVRVSASAIVSAKDERPRLSAAVQSGGPDSLPRATRLISWAAFQLNLIM